MNKIIQMKNHVFSLEKIEVKTFVKKTFTKKYNFVLEILKKKTKFRNKTVFERQNSANILFKVHKIWKEER